MWHLIYFQGIWYFSGLLFCCFILKIDSNPNKKYTQIPWNFGALWNRNWEQRTNIEKFNFFYQFIYTKKGGFIYYIESPVNAMINGLFTFFFHSFSPDSFFLLNSLIFCICFFLVFFLYFVIKEFQNISVQEFFFGQLWWSQKLFVLIICKLAGTNNLCDLEPYSIVSIVIFGILNITVLHCCMMIFTMIAMLKDVSSIYCINA